jgi:hypothetical protein
VVGENGQDVFEEDARRGEVRELAERTPQSYLKTGEFGGAGGGGGGESSLGGIGLEGRVWFVAGRVRGRSGSRGVGMRLRRIWWVSAAHGGEEKRRERREKVGVESMQVSTGSDATATSFDKAAKTHSQIRRLCGRAEAQENKGLLLADAEIFLRKPKRSGTGSCTRLGVRSW